MLICDARISISLSVLSTPDTESCNEVVNCCSNSPIVSKNVEKSGGYCSTLSEGAAASSSNALTTVSDVVSSVLFSEEFSDVSSLAFAGYFNNIYFAGDNYWSLVTEYKLHQFALAVNIANTHAD